MNIKDKVLQLLKYCGGYEGHSYMIDERNVDDFNITLPQEDEIRARLPELGLVLLTGEAGDGKTRMLRNLSDMLKKHGFKVYMDFSEINDEDKEKIINKVDRFMDGKCDEKIILAANIGIFTKTVLKCCPELFEKLQIKRNDVMVLNFERRNLAENKELFQNIVTDFLSFDRNTLCENVNCRWRDNCVFQKNIINLMDKGFEGLRILCDAVYLTGGHITFRELLSLISYMVTFGQSCEQRQKEQTQEKFVYYNIFDKVNDPQLLKFCNLDPAKQRTQDVKESYHSRDACIREKRKRFFESEDISPEKRYGCLYSDYLEEFRTVLNVINRQKPYYFSTIDTNDENLKKLKTGLSKITRAGNTNLKMAVADTPSIFDGSIQTEFDVGNGMETVWKRYDLDLHHRDREIEPVGRENRFFLSYVYTVDKQQDLQEVSMLIDYPLFRFLLMSAEDYYMDRSGVSIEEYAVNTFYRKVLHSMPEAYRKAHIRFDETKRKNFINFSLDLKQRNSVLFGDSFHVRIEKESED